MPCETLELPIGLRATDRFINALRKLAARADARLDHATSAAG